VKVELRILGPVEAVVDGQPLALGAPTQRALLVALLFAPGEVVSRERLVDELWHEPPRSAVQSLQVYVHGLRQALGNERIETHGSSYRLAVSDDAVDLSRVGACRQLFAEIGAALDPGGESEQEKIMEFAAAELGGERAEQLRAEGATLSLDVFDVVSAVREGGR
jgi:DNA-binding SARP family transcriptional activator